MNEPLDGHTIALADVPSSPWKNGGGITRELIAWPNAQDWVWRLSVAEVQRNGPFSRFDGVQRWFAVLAGAGVRLTLTDPAQRQSAHALTPHSAPFCFDGATPVDCDLLDGATQDFNLMVRHDQARAHMQRVNGELSHTTAAACTLALYANAAPAQLRISDVPVSVAHHTLHWQSVPAGTALHVLASDALLLEITPCR